MNYNVHASWQVEFLELVNGLNVWLDNINQSFVRSNLELIHGFFIDVRRTVDGILFDASG